MITLKMVDGTVVTFNVSYITKMVQKSPTRTVVKLLNDNDWMYFDKSMDEMLNLISFEIGEDEGDVF